MASPKYQATKYVGVTFVERKEDKIFYIRYRRGGRDTKPFFEPVGKASQGMTPVKANLIRSDRMAGKELSNTERREEIKAQKATLEKLYSFRRNR